MRLAHRVTSSVRLRRWRTSSSRVFIRRRFRNVHRLRSNIWRTTASFGSMAPVA